MLKLSKIMIAISFVLILGVMFAPPTPAEQVPTPGWVVVRNDMFIASDGGCDGGLSVDYQPLATDKPRAFKLARHANCSITVTKMAPVQATVMFATGPMSVHASDNTGEFWLQSEVTYVMGCPRSVSASGGGENFYFRREGGITIWGDDCAAGHFQRYRSYYADGTPSIFTSQVVAGGRANGLAHCDWPVFRNGVYELTYDTVCSVADDNLFWKETSNTITISEEVIADFMGPSDVLTKFIP